MAKDKVKVKNKDFEVDTDTGTITEITTTSHGEGVVVTESRPVDWLNKKNARASYVRAIDQLDQELDILRPGYTWEEITPESENPTPEEPISEPE